MFNLYYDEYLIEDNVESVDKAMAIINERHANNPPSYYRICGDEKVDDRIMIDYGSWSHFYYLRKDNENGNA